MDMYCYGVKLKENLNQISGWGLNSNFFSRNTCFFHLGTSLLQFYNIHVDNCWGIWKNIFFLLLEAFLHKEDRKIMSYELDVYAFNF
jgi:hypothetical protein